MAMQQIFSAADQAFAGTTHAVTGLPRQASRLATLTQQQWRVLELLQLGKPNKQIAYELEIGESTVKAHVSHILNKLEVHSRTQAVVAARRLGIDASSRLASGLRRLEAATAGGPRTFEKRLATLTPQQLNVLRMLCDGRFNKEIAFALGISEATVKAHVSAILRKLMVFSRTQAVQAAAACEECHTAPGSSCDLVEDIS